MPLPKTGTRTDAQRRARNKWEKNNTIVLGCKMRRDDAEQFKSACYSAGTTPNAVFTAAAADFMEKHAENPSAETAAAIAELQDGGGERFSGETVELIQNLRGTKNNA